MIRALRALLRGLRLLGARRELWPWAALPFAVNLLAFGLAGWAFFANLDVLGAAVSGWIPTPEAHAWWAWLWVGPLRLLGWLLHALLVLLFALLVYFGFTLLGGVIAAPFLEALSERVERVATGAVATGGAHWARSAWRSVFDDARRLLFFLLCAAGIALLGLVPLLQPFALAAELVLAALFIALDFTAPTLGRREVRWPERRAWLWLHRVPMLGFGFAGLVTLLVPGLNFICLPWLVTSGTLLALELGPPSAEPAAQ